MHAMCRCSRCWSSAKKHPLPLLRSRRPRARTRKRRRLRKQPRKPSLRLSSSKEGGKKIKKAKDPHAPKKPKSAFMYFCEETRPALPSGMPFAETGKRLGEMWKAATETQKEGRPRSHAIVLWCCAHQRPCAEVHQAGQCGQGPLPGGNEVIHGTRYLTTLCSHLTVCLAACRGRGQCRRR